MPWKQIGADITVADGDSELIVVEDVPDYLRLEFVSAGTSTIRATVTAIP